MNKIKVGIIGLGVGSKYLETLSRLINCEISCVSDLSDRKLLQVKKRFKGVKLTKQASRLIADPEIEAVFIASYDHFHYSQIIESLKRGKHVFVEKPFCRNMTEANHIKRLLDKGKGRIKFMSNLVLRSAPLYQWLKDQVDHAKFGDIYAVDGEYLYGRIHKITEGWRGNVKDYSVIQGGGIHLIDLMLWITGQRPNSLMSIGNRIATKGSKFRYPDYVVSNLNFSTGMIARISANFGCVHPHQHILRIFGTKQTFLYDDKGPRIYRTRNPKDSAKFIKLSPHPRTKGDLIPEFVSSLGSRRTFKHQYQTFFDDLSVCFASDRSLHKNAKEKVIYI
ncbi:hypothetical protein BVX98_04345 [bacterium F11]|nr:hypothetical protein BVX98_04345 [bacterium F11]